MVFFLVESGGGWWWGMVVGDGGGGEGSFKLVSLSITLKIWKPEAELDFLCWFGWCVLILILIPIVDQSCGGTSSKRVVLRHTRGWTSQIVMFMVHALKNMPLWTIQKYVICTTCWFEVEQLSYAGRTTTNAGPHLKQRDSACGCINKV